MKILKKAMSVILLSVCMFNMFSSHVLAFDNVWERDVFTDDVYKNKAYIIVDDNTPVRYSPCDTSGVDSYLQNGDCIIADEVVVNEYCNSWLHYESNGTDLYIFAGHAKEHTSHCWQKTIDTNLGMVSVCDECGFVSVEYYDASDSNFVFDGKEWIEQLLLGNYSDADYVTVKLLILLIDVSGLSENPIISILSDVATVRDLTADMINTDYVSAAIDISAFIPLVGSLENARDFTIDIVDVFASIREQLREAPIEVRNTMMRNFDSHFDIQVASDSILYTPLENVFDNIFRNRFASLDVTQYMSDISYEEAMSAASTDVDRQWITEHWID